MNYYDILENVWIIQIEGAFHENTITAIEVVQLLFLLIGVSWNSIVAASIFFTCDR